jgi:hypothetical protein
MTDQQDYARELAEIRSMMERSSKFGTLSSWAGIMAGIYALAGAFIAWQYFDFNPVSIFCNTTKTGLAPNGGEPCIEYAALPEIVLLALFILILSAVSAIYFSYRRADKRGEKLWNATSRRLLENMAVPLVTGGLLIVIFISKGMIGLMAPLSLLFYGLALYSASKLTYDEVRVLGVIQIILGLVCTYFVEYGLICWAIGFGIVHIAYGIYIHFKYER